MTKKYNKLSSVTQANLCKINEAPFLEEMSKIRKIAKCSSSVDFTPLTLRKNGQFINEVTNHKNCHNEQEVPSEKETCLKIKSKRNNSPKVTPLILQKFGRFIEKSMDDDLTPIEERLKKKFESDESYTTGPTKSNSELKIAKCQISPDSSGYNILTKKLNQNETEEYYSCLNYETHKVEKDEQNVDRTIFEIGKENQQSLGNNEILSYTVSQDEFMSNIKENHSSEAAQRKKHISKKENYISFPKQFVGRSAKKSILKNSLREKPKSNAVVKKVRFNLKTSPRSVTPTVSNETNCQQNECLSDLKMIIPEKENDNLVIINQDISSNSRSRIKLLTGQAILSEKIEKKEVKKSNSFGSKKIMKMNMDSPVCISEMCDNDAISTRRITGGERQINNQPVRYLNSNLIHCGSYMELVEDYCSGSFGTNAPISGISDEIKGTEIDTTIESNVDYSNELLNFLQTISSVLPSHENSNDSQIDMEDILKEALDELPQRLLNCNYRENDQFETSTHAERQNQYNNLNEVNRKYSVEMLSISGTSVTTVTSMSSQSSKQLGNDTVTQPFQLIRYGAASKEEQKCQNSTSSNTKPLKNTVSQLKVNIDRLTDLVEQLVEKVDKIGNPKRNEKVEDLGTEVTKEQDEQNRNIEISKDSLKPCKIENKDFTRNDLCIKSELTEINEEISYLVNNDMIEENEGEVILNTNKNMVEAGVQTEACTDMVLQATSLNSTVDDAGYAQYCKQGDKMIIKLIKRNTESREICVSKSASSLIHRIPFKDTSSETNRNASQILNEISGTNVELILNNIKKQLTTIKLTSPSMYESRRSRTNRKQTDGPLKGATQMVQKVLHKLCRCMDKFLHPIRQQGPMRTGQMNVQYSERRKRPCETRLSLNVLNNFVPFLKGQDDYSGSNRPTTLIGLDTKCSNGCIRTKFKKIKKDKKSDYSLGEIFHYNTWPYIKRTKYANGQIYFGPLKQMPEPKPKYKRRVELHQTTSDILHQFKGIQCKCCTRTSIWDVSANEIQSFEIQNRKSENN